MKIGLGLNLKIGSPNPYRAGLTEYDWAAEFDAHRRVLLYQDSSLTTPVTGNGQAVGGWSNRGSSGQTMIQGTTTNKPTYYSALFNSAYPGVKFVTDDWMSIDFGSAQWTNGRYWCVFLTTLPTFASGGPDNPFHFDETDITNASPSRWGNQDMQVASLSDRLDLYPQTTAKVQINNRPLGVCCWSIVVKPSGTNNVDVRYLETSAGTITDTGTTQTAARDMRAVVLGARHTGASTVDRTVNEMDLNYWAVMDYTNYPGQSEEEAFMRELLARVGL